MNPIVGLVGPSGSGKSTLILETVRLLPSTVGIVKSLTTRPRRGAEDDFFYDFVSVAEMRAHESRGELIQVSEYAGNLYAHDRRHVERLLAIKIGICALVEQGVLRLRNEGYTVHLLRIVPLGADLTRDEARRKADQERSLKALDWTRVIVNDFRDDGLKRSVGELARFLRAFTSDARPLS